MALIAMVSLSGQALAQKPSGDGSASSKWDLLGTGDAGKAAPAKKGAPPHPAAAPQPAPAAASPAPAPGPTVQLANGATSITEVYGDWTVNCGIANNARVCVFNQSQGSKETGQRVFGIELRAPKDGDTEGTLLMPFGLSFDAGAILKLDDKDLGDGVRFSTCTPAGCLLSISFPAQAVEALKKGQKLTVSALNMADGNPVTFNVSLNGFGAALNRAAQLGG